MASLVILALTLPRAAPPADFHAAFADFVCIDVANGDASPGTVRSYTSGPVGHSVGFRLPAGSDRAGGNCGRLREWR